MLLSLSTDPESTDARTDIYKRLNETVSSLNRYDHLTGLGHLTSQKMQETHTGIEMMSMCDMLKARGKRWKPASLCSFAQSAQTWKFNNRYDIKTVDKE